MPYCTFDALRDRLPALPAQGTNPAIDDRIGRGIASADGQINAALRKFKPTIPLDPVDPHVESISSALAAAYVLDGGFSGGGEDEPTSLAKSLRSWAERQLQMICDGDLLIEGVNDSLDLGSGDDGTVYIPAAHSHLGQTPELDCWDVLGGY